MLFFQSLKVTPGDRSLLLSYQRVTVFRQQNVMFQLLLKCEDNSNPELSAAVSLVTHMTSTNTIYFHGVREKKDHSVPPNCIPHISASCCSGFPSELQLTHRFYTDCCSCGRTFPEVLHTDGRSKHRLLFLQ